MHTFTIGIPRGSLLARLGRNGLVRTSDRIEAVATILVFVFAVAAIPMAATIGMSTHHHQSALYARQDEGVHETIARVTASSSAVATYGSTDVSDVQISWDVNGLPRAASVRWPEHVTPGDQIAVWVDRAGKLTRKPMSSDQAVMDGVVAAVFLWSAVVGAAVGILQLVIWRLDRHRDAEWERTFHALADGGGSGHAGQEP